MNNTIKIAAVFGALAVALGAFGAHSLQDKLDEKAMHVYQTGVSYQFYHVFALLAVGLLQLRAENKFLKWSAHFFITGLILFSGSLYALTAFKLFKMSGFDLIGAITPVGGIMFITGWILLFLGASNSSK